MLIKMLQCVVVFSIMSAAASDQVVHAFLQKHWRVARLDSTFDVPSHVAPAVGCHDHEVSCRSELRLSERFVPRIKRQRFVFGLQPGFQTFADDQGAGVLHN